MKQERKADGQHPPHAWWLLSSLWHISPRAAPCILPSPSQQADKESSSSGTGEALPHVCTQPCSPAASQARSPAQPIAGPMGCSRELHRGSLRHPITSARSPRSPPPGSSAHPQGQLCAAKPLHSCPGQPSGAHRWGAQPLQAHQPRVSLLFPLTPPPLSFSSFFSPPQGNNCSQEGSAASKNEPYKIRCVVPP